MGYTYTFTIGTEEIMFESSEYFDISQIKGKVLNQVCVGLYQVILHFESNISISCGSKMYVFEDKTTKEVVFPPHTRSLGILGLLGEKIVGVELDPNETLFVAFQSGVTVELECENEGYESFEVWIGKDFLIV